MECAVCGRPLRRHNKTGFCYLHCRKGGTESIEIIRRKCLRCDKEFNALGRLNRICPSCHETNKQIVNASRYSIASPQLRIGLW
jgi:Zn finger protein HypA/HybF involved in hydrogenase expression